MWMMLGLRLCGIGSGVLLLGSDCVDFEFFLGAFFLGGWGLMDL